MRSDQFGHSLLPSFLQFAHVHHYARSCMFMQTRE
jgi:hypothetical protein